MNPFKYTKKQHTTVGKYPCDVFTFTNLFNDVMILEVHHYQYSVYVLKFFLKKHKLSQKRYSNQYTKKEIEGKGYRNGATNFFRTLDTVLTVGTDYLKRNELASFGFMGAPKTSELIKMSEDDKTVPDTKRHCIYKLYTLRYFDPAKFTFIENNTASIFFIRNEKNRERLSKDKVRHIIKTEIIPSQNQ